MQALDPSQQRISSAALPRCSFASAIALPANPRALIDDPATGDDNADDDSADDSNDDDWGSFDPDRAGEVRWDFDDFDEEEPLPDYGDFWSGPGEEGDDDLD